MRRIIVSASSSSHPYLRPISWELDLAGLYKALRDDIPFQQEQSYHKRPLMVDLALVEGQEGLFVQRCDGDSAIQLRRNIGGPS